MTRPSPLGERRARLHPQAFQTSRLRHSSKRHQASPQGRRATNFAPRDEPRRDRGGIVGRSDVMQRSFACGSGRARAHRRHHHRRERHGQGTHRQAFTNQARAHRCFCDGQLFKHSDGAFRIRTLRPHARRVHRRSRSQKGLFEVADGGSSSLMKSENPAEIKFDFCA